MIWIGCAGWSIPKINAALFPTEGTHLQRYAACFNAVEINSTFYRPHRPATFARWAASVPATFHFALKAPRTITHEARLDQCAAMLRAFLTVTAELGTKRGPLLFQFPPGFAAPLERAAQFLALLRDEFDGDVVWEPRHPSWFTPPVDELLVRHRIARVAADPPVVPAAATPGGWPGLVYLRLHGAPRLYFSAYPADAIARWAGCLAGASAATARWCIFDNTAAGAAQHNARALQTLLTPMDRQAFDAPRKFG